MNPQIQSRIPEATIFDYGYVIVRHWMLVLLICLPVVAGTVAWSFFMTPTFQAQASIVPPFDSMQGGNSLTRGLLGGVEGAFLRNALNVTSIRDIYAGILESRSMADTILDRFDLMEAYELSHCRWRALRKLRMRTGVNVGKDGLVKISVVDEDPNRAAAMANAYIEELDLQNKRLSGGQATSKRVFLENRLKEIEEKFRRVDNMPAHEARVQESLYELLIRECELAKIEEAKSMPTIQVLDRAVPPERKYEPRRMLMAMKAMAGSFAVAVFLAFLREHRTRMKHAEMKG